MARRGQISISDAAFLRERFADATKDWQPGDACLSFKGNEPTCVAVVIGDIVHLEDGTSGHRTKMRRKAWRV
jgi:hypothetical protein